jgi:hypothetical protein
MVLWMQWTEELNILGYNAVTSVESTTAEHYISEEKTLNKHCCGNPKSYIIIIFLRRNYIYFLLS